ncbi:acyl dehydratase [Microvirga flocculans]|uniref:Acyl dehydratase n=1 Tax=Microvirga flocculans TaxID=217168 RepID=A0A7W6IGL6_9HYPH|nr:MaoC/PaaZ C-terminal domain-containing protein [Microvirga flocculans]MBB4041165.1 acyl dehydratase [Microvirga flocculans]
MKDGSAPRRTEQDQLFFEDLEVGMRVSGRERQLMQGDFQAFSALTGDAHPIHYDEAYASQTSFGRCVAHGLLLTGLAALGASPISGRLHASMVAFVWQEMRFLKPVFIGDRVTPEHEVHSLHEMHGKPHGRVRFIVRLHEQARGIVAEGHHDYLLRTRVGAGA